MEQFDVVVVGARCAGSPLAAQLARAGLSVCLLDRAAFPSDTPSTHIFQRLACFDRLGGTEGTGSRVPRLGGARRCHLAPGERFVYWGYYEGAEPQPTPTMHLHRSGEDFVLACPADAGLLLVIASVPLERERAFLADV